MSLLLGTYLIVFFCTNLNKLHNVETSTITARQGWLNLTNEGPVEFEKMKKSFIYTISNEMIDHDDFDEL